MQLDVEIGEENNVEMEKQRSMMNIVHYTMRYILNDGSDLTPDSKTFAMDVLGHVVEHEDSSHVTKASAYHIMALIEMDSGNTDNSILMEKAARDAINMGMFVEQFDMDV